MYIYIYVYIVYSILHTVAKMKSSFAFPFGFIAWFVARRGRRSRHSGVDLQLDFQQDSAASLQ